MFCVSEAQAAVIRTAFEQRGELSAVVELRRLFPGLGSNRVGSGVRPHYCWLATPADTTVSRAAI